MLNGSTTASATATGGGGAGDNGLHVDAPLLLDGNLHSNGGVPVGGSGAGGGRQMIVSVRTDGGSGCGAFGAEAGGGDGGGGCEDGRRHNHKDAASWTLMFHQANLRKSLLVLAVVFMILGAVIGGIAVLLVRYPVCETGEF